MTSTAFVELLHRSQLLPLERAIVLRWHARWGEEFSEYEFGRRFGPPALPLEGLSEPLRRWAETVSRLRADMIARRGDDWYIFEIKPIAKPAAIGQLEAYEHYWRGEFPTRPAPRLALICEFVPEYMIAPLQRAQIEVFIV